jgi:hypothetical protein
VTEEPKLPWTECVAHRTHEEDCEACKNEYKQIERSARSVIEQNEALEDKLRREANEAINPSAIMHHRLDMLTSLVLPDKKNRAKFEWQFHVDMQRMMEKAISEAGRKKLVSGIPGATIKPIRRT